MTSVWNERAWAYRESDAHREGEDLDLIVEWSAGAHSALDVAAGGGHVTRRLREAGLEVVSCDAAPGMEPDVVCPAESLPFPNDRFDVVACRVAAHHFGDVSAAVRELARVSRERVLIVDNLFMGEEVEEAERLRDRSHVRNYTEAEWRSLLARAGLRVDAVRIMRHPIALGPWLERVGCAGEAAERVRALVAGRIDGASVSLDRIALRTAKPG